MTSSRPQMLAHGAPASFRIFSHSRAGWAAREIPWDRIGSPASAGRLPEPYKWMTTLPASLAHVRDCALQALDGIDATLAYLYETDEKVVIRGTLRERQIRAELKPLEKDSTRILVVVMRGAEVDRSISGRIIREIEHKLSDAGHLLHP